jgi:hypothetical protein
MSMLRMEAQTPVNRSVLPAIFAGMCNLSILVLLGYQTWLEPRPDMSWPLLIRGLYYLTPSVAVIIFRRARAVTFTWASVLFVILAGRAYYLVQSYLAGSRGLEKPSDLPDTLLFWLSAASATLVLLWTIVRVATVYYRRRKRNDAT